MSFCRRLCYDLHRNENFVRLMADLKKKFSEDVNNSRLNASGPRLWSQFSGNDSVASQSTPALVLGHPKLEKLRDMVVKHFQDKKKENITTRSVLL